ncbi:transglutaminase-like domain-containing protein [Candidatus Aalborgicola defluviihabitans]|uniref:transglutaminase-like domain-containing protein n=1 Tax=Candidatus Aalborgicola defluviihabitans TaxID=3386187 RepID=UPI00390B80AD|nr:transglutaminase domain-containing protein [Burkholderiales bacterium]
MTTVCATACADSRRTFLKNSAVALVGTTFPAINFAQSTAQSPRRFNPEPGTWRTFEVTTRVDIQKAKGATRLWVPIPSVNTDWQESLVSSYASNGTTRLEDDGHYGARMLCVEFAANQAAPYVELTSQVRTQNRAQNWAHKIATQQDPATLKFWTQPTELLPTDGLVRKTALAATRGAHTDVEKVKKIYDWIVVNTFREPKVRGCGAGDIATMLETGNLGGKCADLNALFVGLCRAVGVPARDVYGLRVAPSAFGYRELGGNPASLKGAQHCRSEVYLAGYGWVAMDPADVAKVMRQETSEWIKSAQNPLVAPVNQHLFGGWEGNWIGYNMAHDVSLPHAKGPQLGFFMYPVAEDSEGRFDSHEPDSFKYQITAKELKV